MAEEVVVKDQLTDSMMESGRILTRRLAETPLELECALGLYDLDSNQWKFVFSSPLVDKDSPLRVYEVVQEVLRGESLKKSGLKLRNITAVPSHDPLTKAIRSAFKVEGSFADIRFTRSGINNVFVEDSLILFVR